MRRVGLVVVVAILAFIFDLVDGFVSTRIGFQRECAVVLFAKGFGQTGQPAKNYRQIDPPVKKGSREELIYGVGMALAAQLGNVSSLVDNQKEFEYLMEGLSDKLRNQIKGDSARDLLERRGNDLRKHLQAGQAKASELGRKKLQELKEQEGAEEIGTTGVVLKKTVVNPDGVAPAMNGQVRVWYVARFADDNRMFADSESAVFPLMNVIPGLLEGLLMLREGESATLGIPPEQGYGMQGSDDGMVPGGATLFFEIRVLEVIGGAKKQKRVFNRANW